MKRIVFLAAVLAFLSWRRKQFDEDDRRNGYGAFAPVSHPQS